jgi:hypothetical protein
MKKSQRNHIGRRSLRLELLERRNLLAADLFSAENLSFSVDPCLDGTQTLSQEEGLAIDADYVPPQEQVENRQDADQSPNEDAALKRPRDQDSREEAESSTLLAIATADLSSAATQPQEQVENRQDADHSPNEDAALKRPRDQTSR